MAAVGFLSRSLNGPLPYVRCHITVNKNVLSASLNKTFPSFLLSEPIIKIILMVLFIVSKPCGPSYWIPIASLSFVIFNHYSNIVNYFRACY